jgi:predicted MFS family arabinose efflux permease
LILAVGQLVTGTAKDLQAYLIGRVIMGVGTAGNFPVALIVIIDLTSVKRRGLFMGLLNTAFTTGIAFGGVLAAALEHRLNWRPVFWLQIPFAVLAGVGIFFLMPTTIKQNDDKSEPQTLAQKIKSIDYIGVVTLV